ncbi:glycosyltransferase [Piscinibacter sakaiensis]|uniref:Glycosyl transferase, group 2 family protein n=1 Tax=Piscinibacter sakaiensis TaxID=1547922 RepID=A0A0K8P6I7_PISS1|nr:glycosyltransferase [Piscinibacter sakaiensis]GAP38216.1 glycosyl transferase, group 2 family protein [Piscinibacter sakaiensis]
MYPLALVMIVRNESRCLARCLDSARPWVDELCVLDTGSTDDTVAIAQAAGARVATFAWEDDFAAARNRALALSAAPWRLVLDADEWIAGGAECLAALRDTAPGFVGLVPVDSEIDDGRGGRLLAPSWLPRLLPAGVGYAGRIHEQPVWSGPRRRLPLRIGHDGYLPQQHAAKRGRNRRLLVQALAEAPGDAYLQYQLGKDHEVDGDVAGAAPHYAAAARGVAAGAAWRHDLVLRWMVTLKRLGRHAEALALAADEQPHWAESPDFHFVLGDLLLDAALADPARALERLPMIEAAWLRAIEIGERPLLPDSVQGRGSYLAAHNLAAFHESLGQAAAAATWRERAAAWRAAAGIPPAR